MVIPTMMFAVSGSPNISVPTSMAVMGSNTPKTEALVAPILRVAIASVAVDTMVGSSAKPAKLSQSVLVEIPSVMAVSESSTFPRNTKQPTVRA